MTKRAFGCHVSCAGGLENALKNAKTLKVNSIQLHPSAPQRWNTKPFDDGVEEQFNLIRQDSGVEKVFFHAIYLINLATPDKRKLRLAKESLKYYLDLSSRIQGDGVIVHVGSLKDQEDDETGLRQAAEAVSEVLAGSPSDSTLILEVAAGSGKIIGSRFEELRFIADEIGNPERLKYGLDTQHMWASGYDLQGELDSVLSQIDKVFGFSEVAIVHFNDSKTELGSKKDRHENIGDGLIGEKALVEILNSKPLQSIPFVLETPALKSMDTAGVEVEKVQRLLK